jgi:hypothetical protein
LIEFGAGVKIQFLKNFFPTGLEDIFKRRAALEAAASALCGRFIAGFRSGFSCGMIVAKKLSGLKRISVKKSSVRAGNQL